MVAHQPKRIGELLVDAGVINERQLEEALSRKRGTTRRLGAVLVSMGLATEAQICRAVAEQQGIGVVDLNAVIPDPRAVERIPAELALKHGLMPLRFENGRLIVVMADPLDMDGYDAAWRAAQWPTLDRVTAPESDVVALVQEFYGEPTVVQDSLKGIAATEEVTILGDVLRGHAAGGTGDFDASEAINAMLGGAVSAGATQARIEPGSRTTTLRYRIEGKLRRVAVLPASTHAALIGCLRVLFHVDVNQSATHLEGHASLQLGQRQVGLRLSLVPSIHGEVAMVRILDPSRSQVSVEDLGLSPRDSGVVTNLLSLPHGVILVAGPEDSGMSTTLYAFLNHLEEESLSLVSVENPVESLLTGVTQLEVNERASAPFPDTVRAALRLDPDVLMISEILDPETAGLALRAAMSGRLVLAGVRAEGAASAAGLLLDMGLEPYLLASALRGLIGQRLVHRICPACSKPTLPDARSMERLELTPDAICDKELRQGQGCSVCGATGYAGRVGIFEVAKVNRALRERIASRASMLEIARVARESGMRTLRDDALDKVFEGITTLSQAAEAVPLAE